MALTAVAIRNAKGRAKLYKLTDGDGLFLYVTPNGGRYWRMNYRHLGKQKTLAFGVYPDTGLADACEQRDAARKMLTRGDDSAERIKLEKVAAAVAASNSFKAVADEWLVKVEHMGFADNNVRGPDTGGQNFAKTRRKPVGRRRTFFIGTTFVGTARRWPSAHISRNYTARYCSFLGLEARADTQYDTTSWPALANALTAAFASETQAHWIEIFSGTDACGLGLILYAVARD